MSTKTIERTESEILELWPGMEIDVTFERETDVTVDNNYGADADGRRGETAEFIDGERFSCVTVNGLDLEYYDAEFQKKVKASIQKWMDENPVE